MEMTESNHMFSCAFGGGVTATATVDTNAVRSGRGDAEWIKVKYDGLVTPANAHLLRAWMLDVHQKVANLLDQPVTWGFGADERTLEVYRFEPGQAYRRVR